MSKKPLLAAETRKGQDLEASGSAGGCARRCAHPQGERLSVWVEAGSDPRPQGRAEGRVRRDCREGIQGGSADPNPLPPNTPLVAGSQVCTSQAGEMILQKDEQPQ